MHRRPGFENHAIYHPLLLYESPWNLASAIFWILLGRRFFKTLRPDDITFSYLINYAKGQFLLEFPHLDSSLVAGLNISQLFMLLVRLSSSAVLASRRWKQTRAGTQSGVRVRWQSGRSIGIVLFSSQLFSTVPTQNGFNEIEFQRDFSSREHLE